MIRNPTQGEIMKREITIAAIQMAISKGEPTSNISKALDLLNTVAEKGAELMVLPEMWLTDFILKDPYPYLDWTSKALKAIRLFCQKKECIVVAGSIMEEEDGRIYNTSFVIDNNGIAGKYRKAHLFEPMGELRVFSPGNKSHVIETPLAKLGVIICYDLRFPELTRPLPFHGTEILCIPAQWPSERIDHWTTLLKARAIENQLFVVGCNRWGKVGPHDFPGHSLIIDPPGNVLAAARKEGVALAKLEPDVMENYREEIPVLRNSCLARY